MKTEKQEGVTTVGKVRRVGRDVWEAFGNSTAMAATNRCVVMWNLPRARQAGRRLLGRFDVPVRFESH